MLAFLKKRLTALEAFLIRPSPTVQELFCKKVPENLKKPFRETAFVKAVSGVWEILFPGGFQRQGLWRGRAEPGKETFWQT